MLNEMLGIKPFQLEQKSLVFLPCCGSGSAWIYIIFGSATKKNPDLDPDQIKIRIRIRIKVISWIRNRIRICINLRTTSQNVWNMNLFNIFKRILASIWKLGSGSGSGFASGWKIGSGSASNKNPYPHLDPHQIKIRIRIRISVMSRIQIRIKVVRIHNTASFYILWRIFVLSLLSFEHLQRCTVVRARLSTFFLGNRLN
jgi:hypothetical protein